MSEHGDVWHLPPMSDDGIAVQPTLVWACVEEYLSGHWRGRVRQVGATGNPPTPGWLTLDAVPKLDALGAPARAAFTACALRQRMDRPLTAPDDGGG